MKDLNKRLVEVEYVLKKLEVEYLKKIPQEVWDYIEENKDKNYAFEYDENKTLVEQNLSVDTISLLTYINMEYLLDEEDKKEMKDFLKKTEIIAEQEKSKRYNSEDLFKNKNESKKQDTSLVEVKIEKWYEKLFSFFKSIFKRQ